jgi:lysophospholipase L1-like esterase
MRSWFVIGALVGVALVVGTVAPVLADPPHGSTYLALGDSIAFGYRGGLPPQDYLDQSMFVGYPEKLAPALGVQLTNASCPGETSGSFSSASAPDHGCRDYRAHFPLHTDYAAAETQLEFAKSFLAAHPSTQLVTLDIGANDLLALEDSCAVAGANASQCELQGLPPLLKALSSNLDTIYNGLRSDAHYGGTIVALTYYATDYRDPMQLAAVGSVDAVVASRALAHGANVGEGFAAFAIGSRTTGGDPCKAGLLNILPDGTCDIHPSSKGQDLLAKTIRLALIAGG